MPIQLSAGVIVPPVHGSTRSLLVLWTVQKNVHQVTDKNGDGWHSDEAREEAEALARDAVAAAAAAAAAGWAAAAGV
jgi:hypothetical protein